MKAFLINLERHEERRVRMLAEAERLGFELVWNPGVDARLDADAVRRSSHFLADTEKRGGLMDHAVIESHRQIWRRIADDGSPFCAVFEDDVDFADDIAAFLNSTDWIPPDAEIVRLETFFQKTRVISRPATTFLGRDVVLMTGSQMGTGGYIVSRAGAHSLLRATERAMAPVDVLLFESALPTARKFRTYQVRPALCVQFDVLSHGDVPEFLASTVTAERRAARGETRTRTGSMRKIWREAKRPFSQFARIVGDAWGVLTGRIDVGVIEFRR